MVLSHWNETKPHICFLILARLDLIKQVDHRLQSMPSSRSQHQSEPRSSLTASRSTGSAFTPLQNQEETMIIVMPAYFHVLLYVGKRLLWHVCDGELLLLHFGWLHLIQHVGRTGFFELSG